MFLLFRWIQILKLHIFRSNMKYEFRKKLLERKEIMFQENENRTCHLITWFHLNKHQISVYSLHFCDFSIQTSTQRNTNGYFFDERNPSSVTFAIIKIIERNVTPPSKIMRQHRIGGKTFVRDEHETCCAPLIKLPLLSRIFTYPQYWKWYQPVPWTRKSFSRVEKFY